MAIWDKLPEKVQILVDGKVAVEYEENESHEIQGIPPKKVVKYIQCISNA